MVQTAEGGTAQGPYSTDELAQQVVAGQLKAEARVRPAHARHGDKWTPVDHHPPIAEAVTRLRQQAEIAESQAAERGGAAQAEDQGSEQKGDGSAYVLFGGLFLALPALVGVWLRTETNLGWPATVGCLVALEIAIALWVWFDFPGL
jgi:hypothetical protein